MALSPRVLVAARNCGGAWLGDCKWLEPRVLSRIKMVDKKKAS